MVMMRVQVANKQKETNKRKMRLLNTKGNTQPKPKGSLSEGLNSYQNITENKGSAGSEQMMNVTAQGAVSNCWLL